MRKIYLIREKKSKFGGAEVYLSRLSSALADKGVEHEIINSIFPSFLPSWLRIILFNLQVCLTKKNKFYFSLERIICPDIYRAGDGVHKVFLTIEKKSKLNLLHPVYLFLEKRCFNNAKRIIANSNMVKNEIVNTYDINPEKILSFDTRKIPVKIPLYKFELSLNAPLSKFLINDTTSS